MLDAGKQWGTAMEQTFAIEGMHCQGCVTRVAAALRRLADDVEVTLSPPRAVLDTPQPLPLDEVQAAVSQAGDYRVHAA